MRNGGYGMQISDPTFVAAHIFLDPDAEPLFNDDGSINLALSDTVGLTHIVDAFREETGLLPMLPTLEHKNDYDQDGWYNFYLDVSPADDDRTDSMILVVVDSQYADDDGSEYNIELSDDVRKALYEHLNAESTQTLGACFASLFAEARRYAVIE